MRTRLKRGSTVAEAPSRIVAPRASHSRHEVVGCRLADSRTEDDHRTPSPAGRTARPPGRQRSSRTGGLEHARARGRDPPRRHLFAPVPGRQPRSRALLLARRLVTPRDDLRAALHLPGRELAQELPAAAGGRVRLLRLEGPEDVHVHVASRLPLQQRRAGARERLRPRDQPGADRAVARRILHARHRRGRRRARGHGGEGAWGRRSREHARRPLHPSRTGVAARLLMRVVPSSWTALRQSALLAAVGIHDVDLELAAAIADERLCGSGDQARSLSYAEFRVRFRCRLPSAFMT